IATIGNNEGMTISHDALNTLYDNAEFDVTCANVFDEQGDLPRNITSSIIKEIEGVRILFVASTAPFTPFYRALDWVVTNSLKAIREDISANQDASDMLMIMASVCVFIML